MRVIAGLLGGRTLAAVPGRGTRPTTDRVREALFSRLASLDALEGAVVLDLFAGSGALGIEALSRGARRLVAVEKDRTAVGVIQRNLEALGIVDRAEVIGRDWRQGLDAVRQRGERFDLVVADPPYGKGLAEAVLVALAASGLVREGGVAAVEAGAREAEFPVADGFEQLRRDRYGDTSIAVYRHMGVLS